MPPANYARRNCDNCSTYPKCSTPGPHAPFSLHLRYPCLHPHCLPPCPQKSVSEERLQRLSAQYRIPRESSTTVAHVEGAARARRALQGQEVAWPSDILAKVGGPFLRSCTASAAGCTVVSGRG